MKYKAVIFDLFGTLVPNFSLQEYRQTIFRMARILNAAEEDFWKLWSATLQDSLLGALYDPPARITYICGKMGLEPAEKQVREAARLRFEHEAQTLIPRVEAVEVLEGLKSGGYKTGLISDCTLEAADLWESTPLAAYIDAAVFSCLEGMKKPDPRIYRLALDRLRVRAEEVCYIGDGSSRELSGAAAAGLKAVQLCVPGEDGPDVFRIDREDWQGESIESLNEVPGLM